MSDVRIRVSGKQRARMFMEHCAEWKDCTKCKIGRCAYRKVFFRGQLPCQILFVGEGPGKTEDVLGYPFVGLAGNMFERLVKHVTVRWGVTNTVLCRPCEALGAPNRPPSQREMMNCFPRLKSLVQLSGATTLVSLGRVAEGVLQLGWFTPYNIFHVAHPSHILRKGGVGSEFYDECVERITEINKEAIECHEESAKRIRDIVGKKWMGGLS